MQAESEFYLRLGNLSHTTPRSFTRVEAISPRLRLAPGGVQFLLRGEYFCYVVGHYLGII